jgi:hypothetical protein
VAALDRRLVFRGRVFRGRDEPQQLLAVAGQQPDGHDGALGQQVQVFDDQLHLVLNGHDVGRQLRAVLGRGDGADGRLHLPRQHRQGAVAELVEQVGPPEAEAQRDVPHGLQVVVRVQAGAGVLLDVQHAEDGVRLSARAEHGDRDRQLGGEGRPRVRVQVADPRAGGLEIGDVIDEDVLVPRVDVLDDGGVRIRDGVGQDKLAGQVGPLLGRHLEAAQGRAAQEELSDAAAR